MHDGGQQQEASVAADDDDRSSSRSRSYIVVSCLSTHPRRQGVQAGLRDLAADEDASAVLLHHLVGKVAAGHADRRGQAGKDARCDEHGGDGEGFRSFQDS